MPLVDKLRDLGDVRIESPALKKIEDVPFEVNQERRRDRSLNRLSHHIENENRARPSVDESGDLFLNDLLAELLSFGAPLTAKDGIPHLGGELWALNETAARILASACKEP